MKRTELKIMTPDDKWEEYSKYPKDLKDKKRVTIYISNKHKRFLEDLAHMQRYPQYEILYYLLNQAMRNYGYIDDKSS